MTTSAATWRLPIATCRKKRSNDVTCTNTVRVQLQEGEDDKERRIWTKGGCVHEDPKAGLLQYSQKDPSRGVQDRCPQILRKILQHLPHPSREAELPLRAQEDLRVGDEDSSKEGQEVQLH